MANDSSLLPLVSASEPTLCQVAVPDMSTVVTSRVSANP